MSAADAAGNIWYGGLASSNGAPRPSRIVIALGARATSFVNTVGLPAAHDAGDAGQADDDDRQLAGAARRFGRLYVIWDEPRAAGSTSSSASATRGRAAS